MTSSARPGIASESVGWATETTPAAFVDVRAEWCGPTKKTAPLTVTYASCAALSVTGTLASGAPAASLSAMSEV